MVENIEHLIDIVNETFENIRIRNTQKYFHA